MDNNIDLVSLPKKSFWKLSIPLVGFCLFDTLYSLIDLWWISQTHMESFFGLVFSIPIIAFLFSLGSSFGQGTNSIISRFIGSNHYRHGYNSLIHGLILCLIVWLCIIAITPFIKTVLTLLVVGLDNGITAIIDYLFPMFVFSFSFILLNFFAETMQAEGDSKRPTILIISANILNIILDPIFIFVLGWEVKGAAYATILSSLISLSIMVYLYLSSKTKVPLSLSYFKFDSYIVKEILKVAIPNFLDKSVFSISGFFINYVLLSTIGVNGIIIYSVSNQLKDMVMSPIKGFSKGIMSVTGHLFGAKKFDDLEEIYAYVLKISILTVALIMIAFFIFRNEIFAVFSINQMDMIIFWISIFGLLIALSLPFSMITSKMFDGFGKSTYSLLFTLLKIVFQIVSIYLLNLFLSDGSSVLFGITLSEIVFAAVYYFSLKYFFKKFKRIYKDKETVVAN